MAGLAAPAVSRSRPHLFSALQVRDYRQLWLSTVALGSGQQMEIVTLGWYILQQTDSPVLVGLIAAARMWGMFLAPFGGVLADRVSRRTLLLIVQSIVLAGSLLVLGLILAGTVQVWHIFAITVIAGLARAFDNTTRQTLIGDLVERDRLTNAVAMNQAAMNGSAVLAPAIAGALFGIAGIAGCFAVISLLNLSAFLATLMIRPIPVVAGNGQHSPARDLVEGLSYVRRNDTIAALMWLAAIANLCGFPLGMAMMPSFARDVLGVGSFGLGTLLSSMGLGAVIGSLVLGGLGDVRSRGKGALLAMFGWMLGVALFAASAWLPLAMLVLVFVGACQSTSMALVASLILAITPEALRGRVMGVRMFAIATLPVGGTVAGWLIAAIGAPATALVYAAAGALLTGAVALRIPELARRQ